MINRLYPWTPSMYLSSNASNTLDQRVKTKDKEIGITNNPEIQLPCAVKVVCSWLHFLFVIEPDSWQLDVKFTSRLYATEGTISKEKNAMLCLESFSWHKVNEIGLTAQGFSRRRPSFRAIIPAFTANYWGIRTEILKTGNCVIILQQPSQRMVLNE